MTFISRIFIAFFIVWAPWGFILQSRNACAQLVTDGTLGPAASLSGPDYAVSSDLGTQIGGNLFHSFETFDINTGESATFSGPDSIQNIISRVTGGSASFIDGVLRSGINGVDFFFLNPAGVMFGPNASLDISGSFHVSTADYLRLSDNGRFDASAPQNSVLTSAQPAAFGFLGENPTQAISVAGELWTPQGETLSVVGGDITITGGFLIAQGGRINMAAVNASGEVNIDSMDVSGFDQLGNIEMTDSSYMYASDAGGGDIYIRGNHFEINNSHVWSLTWEDQDGGIIDIELNGNLDITAGATVAGATGGGGKGTDIFIKTDTLTIADNGAVYGFTTGNGKGADLDIDVTDLEISNGGIIDTRVGGDGDGGNLSINAENAVMISGQGDYDTAIDTRVTSSGSGSGGNLMMTADTLTLQDGGIIQAETRGSGTGSRVDLNLRTLELTGGGTISVGSTSSGQGGDLNIYAEESVNISGAMLLGEDESATGSCIYAYAPNVAGLDASQIDIDSTTLTLADGGAIFSFATGEGQAADISIQASASVSISGFQSNLLNVISSQTGGSGDAGNIQVNTGTLTLTGTGGIETISSGIGEAGDIDLYVSSLTIQDGGMIYASALDQGNGGNITVSASEFIDTSGYFEDSPSGLCFQALISACTWQNGNAGNISLSAPVITLADKGNIDAFSFGSGNAGDIDIACSSLTLDGEGAYIYTDIAGSGNGGDIKIITDQLTITGGAGISADVYGVDPNIIEANNATWDTDLSTGTGEATGQGGTLSITATDSVIISGTNDDRDISSSLSTSTSSSGNGGNLFLSTPNVMISDGGWIQATAKNDGNSGNIQIDVEILTLTNGGQVNATTTGTGHGGNIDISASKQIAVSGDYNEEQLSGIQARTKGSGDAGEISVSSPLLTMANGGEINVSSLDGTGNGGSIRIDASFMDMQSNAAISAQSTGNGRAGSLFIQTDEAISLHSSRITTESLDANGGNITLNTVDHLYLLDGQITTSVQGGSGNGGNIDIDPCFVVLNNSQIIANAFEGNGGNIHIVSDYFLAGPESTVMASSQLGIDGTVQIDSPDTDISGRLANLKTPDLDVTALLHSSCALKTMDTSSSLIVTGRGGVLSAPDDFMSIVYFDDESEDVLAK